MEEQQRQEALLRSWVQLSVLLKNSRITRGLSYNEATVMLLLYSLRQEEGEELCPVSRIVESTRMLKSQVNHVLNSLEKKGLIRRCPGQQDRRTMFVSCVEEQQELFLQVHRSSRALAAGIIEIIGPEDADTFIRIVRKLAAAEMNLREGTTE